MEIALIKEGYNKRILRFYPDSMDAEPAVRTVFFEGEKIGRVSEQRWALIAFLMVREVVGNCVSFQGFTMPPHLAAAFERDAAMSELFLSPIDNEPARILPKEHGSKGSVFIDDLADYAQGNDLVISEYELGFQSRLVGGGECDMPILKTNLRLWAALCSSEVELLVRSVVSLIACDVYGVRTCSIGLREVSDQNASERIESVCREAGVNVC